MNDPTICEERVSAYPLRIAGGFPCFRPAKYVMNHRNFEPRKVCGMHRNVLLRENWIEAASPISTAAGKDEEE